MVNEKDVMRKLKYFAGIAAALMLWGCSEDKFVPDQYLNGLGGDEYVLNEIDEWIIDNYTRPYNMEVKYRWDQSELDLNRTLVPIKEELVVSVMKVVQEIWIKPYEQLAELISSVPIHLKNMYSWVVRNIIRMTGLSLWVKLKEEERLCCTV